MIETGICPPINEEKIEEALAIFKSIASLEREIFVQMSLLEEAVNNDFLEDMAVANQRIRQLNLQFEEECRNADAFIKKYAKKQV